MELKKGAKILKTYCAENSLFVSFAKVAKTMQRKTIKVYLEFIGGKSRF